MNKLVAILSIVSLLQVSTAHAQETTSDPPLIGMMLLNLSCFDFMELRDKLKKEHGEMPFLSSEGLSTTMNMMEKQFQMAPHKMYLFANPKTYNYTLVFRMSETVGCIVSSGGELGPVIQETPL